MQFSAFCHNHTSSVLHLITLFIHKSSPVVQLRKKVRNTWCDLTGTKKSGDATTHGLVVCVCVCGSGTRCASFVHSRTSEENA